MTRITLKYVTEVLEELTRNVDSRNYFTSEMVASHIEERHTVISTREGIMIRGYLEHLASQGVIDKVTLTQYNNPELCGYRTRIEQSQPTITQ